MLNAKTLTLLDPVLVKPAILAAFSKLSPRVQWRNPVMFVVYIGSILTTFLWLQGLQGFVAAIAVWLWFTVLFANFAEALAEGRSKAQAASLRGLKKSTWAKKLRDPKAKAHFAVGPPQGEIAPSGGSAVHEVTSVGAAFTPDRSSRP